MSAQQFNETFNGNAKVPGSGGFDQGPDSPSGSGSPAGGTENLKETTKTIMAENVSTPSGKNQIPSGVDSFPDGV